MGLPLGVLDGLVLFALATSHRNAEHPDLRRYLRVAGIACAAGSLLALMTDYWALYGFLDPDRFAVTRAMGLFIPSKFLGDATKDFANLTLWAIAPMLIALFASWLTGRAVAGWYARKVSETRSRERDLDAEDERSPT